MKKPKAFIFDIFGVLCESFYTKWEKENWSLISESFDEFLALSDEIDLGKKFQSDYCDLAAKKVGKTPGEIKQKIESSFNINYQLFDIVARLKKEYKTAICSNSSAVLTREMFSRQALELNNYFDEIFISSEVGLIKPDPKIFTLCADRLGLDLAECVFIDDSSKNIQSARSIGMIVYHFQDVGSFKEWLKDNNYCDNMAV